MKVLITGGAGFIGSHLQDRLVERGDSVVIVDNLNTGRRDNVLAGNKNVQFYQKDIFSRSEMFDIFYREKPDVCVHAAAGYKDPNNWYYDSKANVVGTINIANAAKECGVRRVIYLQTSLCYGLHPDKQPIPIDYPLKPEGTSYAITKTGGENLLFLNPDLDVISFRLANHFGDRNLSGPVPTFYLRLTQGKSCFVMDTRRDFVYVSDLIRLMLRAVDGEGSRGAYHVSTGSDYHIRELYNGVREAMDMEPDPGVQIVPRGADDAPTLLLDPSKTYKDFPGWKAETPLKEGISNAVEWYNTHEMTETYTHLKNVKE